MIKWDKPIQAMDGRHARVIAHLPDPPGDPNDPGFFTPTMVWVQSATNGFGDVFLVNNRGVRCDDTAKSARALLAEIREPFIRNAPMKREGWVLMRPPIEALVSLSGILAHTHVYPSEEEARKAMDYYSVEPGTKPVHLAWEE
jgi:hypothetical protein